ncbi:protein kinase C zeta type-like [Tamandua tetradactyla]|uniref:protein kinase C zeta type-like n=1 Tax=Tamandua tetradactyla TaxID=48850 RepID=UPI004054423A
MSISSQAPPPQEGQTLPAGPPEAATRRWDCSGCSVHDSVMPSQESPADGKKDDVALPSGDTDGITYVSSTRKHGSVKDDSEDLKPVIDGMDRIKISQRLGLQDFDLIRGIGCGSYAKVLLVRLKKSAQVYAMKVVKKELVHDDEDIDGIDREAYVRAGVQQPLPGGLTLLLPDDKSPNSASEIMSSPKAALFFLNMLLDGRPLNPDLSGEESSLPGLSLRLTRSCSARGGQSPPSAAPQSS